MKRQFVLVLLLAVAFVGVAKGQGTSENETSAKQGVAKKFVQPTTQEVTLVIASSEGMSEKDKDAEKAALAVESQWIGSFGDRKLLDSTLAPGFLFLAERWGTGYWQDRAQTLLVRTGRTPTEVNYKPDHRIMVHVFRDTVILTGVSYTILRYNGKLSKVTRQFMFVYGKQDNGRWLILGKAIADIPKGLSPPAPAMMLLGPNGQPPPAPASDRFIYRKGSSVPDLAAPAEPPPSSSEDLARSVALVGVAKGQGTSAKETSAKKEAAEKDVRPATMPVTLVIAPNEGMSEKDKAAEKAALEVESQFIHSFNGNRKLMDSILAPGFMNLSERWGTGYWQDKAQTLDLRTGPAEKEVNTSIDHRIAVHVFGNTVILTGISYTVLSYNGKPSKVTRLFMFVYGKQDNGRWLILGKAIADIPKGLSPPAPAMMLLGPNGQPPPAPAGSTSIYHYHYHDAPAVTPPSN